MSAIGCGRTADNLVIATTTSTYDSGLMAAILPDFEAQHGVRVDLISVGTGEALRLGQAGDADVVLVHAREREDQFMAEGHGIDRRDVMCNDFVIVGPTSDPAQIMGEIDAADALTQIATAEANFFSRGDDSGTHIREMALWEAAGIVPSGDWYNSIGQGMGATLTLANEREAYALVDRGTYLKRDDLDLTVVVEGDARLLNAYGVMMVNPAAHDIDQEAAAQFIDWLVSAATQAKINAYTVNGRPLFRTDCGF